MHPSGKWSIRARLGRSSFVRSVGILASAQGIAYLIGIVSIPLVTRLYTPSAVGEVALISSLAGVSASAASLGIQSAVVKARHDRDAHLIMSVGILLSTVLLVVGLVLALVSDVNLAKMGGGDTAIPPLATLICIAGIASFTNINSYLNYYANRRSANRVLFTNTLIGAFSTLLITVPLGFIGAGAWGLLAGTALSILISSSQMIVRLRPPAVRPTPARVRLILTRYRDFVKFLYPANLLETFTAQLPRQVLALQFGSASLGQLSMNDRVLAIPMRLLGAPISTIYFREASQRRHRGEDVGVFTYRIVTRILHASIIPVGILILWGGPVFGLVLGQDWSPAGRIAGLLAVPTVLQLARISVGAALVVVDRQRVNLLLGFLRLLAEGGALLLGIILQLDVFTFLGVFAIASTLFYIVDMTVTLRTIQAPWRRYIVHAILYAGLISLVWIGKTIAS